MKAQTLVQFLAIAATSASAAQYGSSVRRSSPQRIGVRSDSTGPTGYLTVDDTADYKSLAGNQFSTAGGDAEVFSSEHVEGAYTSCIPVFEGATVEDCQKVIADIRANNETVSVTGGHCMNWQEGTCLARVCGREQNTTYEQDPQWIADAIEENALNTCVAKGQSGVVADCEDNADPCGTYRFWLQSHP
ncbi:hypothetical protein SLS62_001020 [Diatrype stigma]|uniref:Ecp2 effector protein domain-containing protein n=1 Tax=Diatrype stigma TaxID=117547 RepID=A0AAN9V9H8_9PEZI